MKEKNKDVLKKAMNELKQYGPKDSLWDKVDEALDNQQSDDVFQAALDKLPSYQAPEEVWSRIEKQLPTRRRKILFRNLALAASVSLLIAFLIFNNKSVPNKLEIVTIEYTEQEVPKKVFTKYRAVDTAARDSAFKTIVRAQKKGDKKAKEVLAELEQLDASKIKLENILNKYDTNNALFEKLEQIEQDQKLLQEEYLSNI